METSETAAIDAPSGRLEDVINQFSGTRPYNRDGYSGTLTLDAASIQIKPTKYEMVTNSYPHRVTKQYALAYNDRSLVPETVRKSRCLFSTVFYFKHKKVPFSQCFSSHLFVKPTR